MKTRRVQQLVKLRKFYGKWNSKVSFDVNEKEKRYVKHTLMKINSLIQNILLFSKRAVKVFEGMIDISSSYIPKDIRRKISFYDKGLLETKNSWVQYRAFLASFSHGDFDYGYIPIKTYVFGVHGIDPNLINDNGMFGVGLDGVIVRCKHNTELWIANL